MSGRLQRLIHRPPQYHLATTFAYHPKGNQTGDAARAATASVRSPRVHVRVAVRTRLWLEEHHRLPDPERPETPDRRRTETAPMEDEKELEIQVFGLDGEGLVP